ncbi:MAG: hypothetical protein KGJ32_10290 [Xanthomonadaceae bacterium]|nr:hypothetical protein [Xanthomonadaceae bacterium]
MKKLIWALGIVIGVSALAYGVQQLQAVYAARWDFVAGLCYMEGNDAQAGIYAQRLRWVDKDDSDFLLAKLDVTRSIPLNGTSRDSSLMQARRHLKDVNPEDWRLSSRMELAMTRAFLDAELGDVSAAREGAQNACRTLRPSYVSFDDCMQSIAYEVLPGSRNDALPAYERATLALKIHSGNSVLSSFYLLLAIRYFDVDKAHAIRTAMIKDGVYTDAMQHRYCERVFSQDADICKPESRGGGS